MGLFDRFFGRKDDAPGGSPLVANTQLQNPLSLQLLFSGPLSVDPQALGATLRQYHRDLSRAQCEVDPTTSAQGTPLGLAGWGKHVVQLVGFNAPMPTQAVETCIAPAHYGPELKQQARAHHSHVILYYAGYEPDPYEQYVALAAAAGALAPQGAIVVLNESGRTSIPIGAIAPGVHRDMMAHLRNLPLLLLYAGFVKGEVPGIPGIWMRTFGCPLLRLPDLAMHVPSHDFGETTFGMFCSILDYIRTSGAEILPGNTSQVGPEDYLRFRSPLPQETFLQPEGPLLVCERITAAEINR